MNVYTKRTTLIFMTLLLALTLSFGAVAAGSANYNSGQRNEVCTSLTDAAVQYYQDNYTYEALSAQEGTDLLTSLRTLMTTTHKKKTSYSDCRDMAYLTDSQSGDGKIVLLYTSVLVTQGDFIGSGSIG